MTRFLTLENGRVSNITVGEEPPEGVAWAAGFPEEVGIGWTFSGGEFSPPVPVVTVPASVTMRQARLALLAAGKLDAVDAAVASQDRATQITWEFAQEVQRDNQLLAALAPALGLDDAALDALFVEAATL